MIDCSDIEKKVNRELMNGYRLVFMAIAKEIRQTAIALKKTSDNASGEEIARLLCDGSKEEPLLTLSNELNYCGNYLLKVSAKMKDYISDNHSDFMNKELEFSPSWLDDPRAFREQRYIVDMMLSKYSERLETEIDNAMTSQLFGRQR